MPPARRRRRLDPEADAARTAAEAELTKLRASLAAAEKVVEKRREDLAQRIADHLSSGVLAPTEAADSSGYDRVTVSRLARERGAAPTRPPDLIDQARPDRSSDP